MNAVSWHVIPGMTTQTTILSPNGAGLQDVEEVTYQIDSGPAMGTRRKVTIPVALYNEANVRAAIEQDVATVTGIAGLSG